MTLAIVSTAVTLGGAERYMFELARWLAEREEDIRLIVAEEIADATQNEMKDTGVPVEPAAIGWDYGPEDNIAGSDYAAKVARQKNGMAKAFRGTTKLPRLTFFNANWPTHYVGAMQAANAADAAFGVHFHLCPHRVYLNRLAAEAHKDAMAPARFLGCVSQNNRFFLERTFGSSFTFRVIYNGSRFQVTDSSREKLLANPRSNTFLFVGRLDHQKGLVDVLPALTGLKPEAGYEVHVLGDGPLRPLLEASLPKAGSPVRVMGSVPDIEARMSSAAAMLLPSHFEGLSLSILEALSLGCIPIVSRASSANEIIEDGRNGFLFDVADWRSMLRAMDRFVAADQDAIRKECLATGARFTRHSMLEGMRETLQQYAA